MNAKFAFAVFLALQVSLTLCELPEPSPDLVAKYNELKSTFLKRIINASEKLKKAADPYVEKASAHGGAQEVKAVLEDIKNKHEVASAIQVASAIAEEMAPAVDKARTAVLGFYGHYLRSHIGEYLDHGINSIKVVLDKVLPVEN